MPPAEDFKWTFDREFSLPSGVVLRALQRDILDEVTLEIDLAPFLGATGHWGYRTGRVRIASQGVLVDYRYSHGDDHFGVRWQGYAEACDAHIARVALRQLTVWRFAEQLDLLQIRVVGHNGTIYGHVGGEHTLGTLAVLAEAQDEHPDVLAAIQLFNTGSLEAASDL